MAQMTLPAEPSYQRTSYSGLLGADFSADPSLVDRKHSPGLLNMISDNGGNPVKRPGWEVVFQEEYGAISNMWSFAISGIRFIAFTEELDDTARLRIIYEDGQPKKITKDGEEVDAITVTTGRHCGFYTEVSDGQTGFYLMDGTTYHRIYDNGGVMTYEEVTPYAPLVLIARTPTGGGVQYEDINLITKARKEQFLNTSNNKTFLVSSKVDTSKPYSAKYRTADGWADATISSVSGSTFTLSAAHNPVLVGQDNISIEYYADSESNADKILSCTVSARYSATTQDQIFLSGGPKKNYVYYSAPNDLTYFPDLNYINVGGETSVMGFLNLGEYLAIVKESASYDSSIFLAYQTSIKSQTVSSTDSAGQTTSTTTQIQTFAVKRATTGVGATSKYAFGVLNDEPLFLSPYGVQGIISYNLTSEKVVRNRSYYVDSKLTQEYNLSAAVACVWNNYYVCVVNDHAYVLDGRHKSTNYSGNTNYQYEAYYWENIPAAVLLSYDKELWFGTTDGRVCRFKNSGQSDDYSDGTVKNDDTVEGTAIRAVWSTPNDNDGKTEWFKTMMKKGSMCTVAPFDRSSVKVYISVDGYDPVHIGTYYVDISRFFTGEIDFDRLGFDSRTGPRDSFFKKKKKKYKRLQIILENDEINEPFGVYEIVKTYVYQRFAK